MKKIKPFLALAAVAAVGAVVGGVELADIMTFLFGGSGAALAFAGVVGTPTNDAVNAADAEDAGIVDQDLSKDITLFNPDRFPLDTMTRELLKKKGKATSQKVKYFQKSTKPFSDVIKVANTDATKTSIVVTPETRSTWRTKDTLVMRGVGTGGADVMFQVSSVTEDTITLKPISQDKIPTWSANQVVYRLGNAMSEKDMTTEPFAVYPEEFTQFCQNFMAQIEETTFAGLTEKKVDWDFNDMEIENLYSLRGEIEASFLFGVKHEIKNGSDTTLFTNGIVHSIDKKLTYGTGGDDRTLTKEMYTKWMESIFTGNNGSKERVLLAGSGLVSAISLLRETDKVMQNNTQLETYLGVKCTSIVSDFGTLKIVHAPLLDELGWKENGIAIDLEHLYKKEFVPMHATELDLKGSGQRNANAKVIQEVSCLILRHPDCHAIIEPAA
jgi:hypothetical protein